MTLTRRLTMALVLAAMMTAASPAAAQPPASQSQAQADALAIWRARQAAQQAETEANIAASKAGQAQGSQIAQEQSRQDQVKMVTDAVTGWKAPRQYSAASSANVVLQDPFAPAVAGPQLGDVPITALGTSGLVWDAGRRLAQVGTSSPQLCGGRLKVGDYPALPDGNLLDTPARITTFLSTCSDPLSPLTVIVESGEIAVRK